VGPRLAKYIGDTDWEPAFGSLDVSTAESLSFQDPVPAALRLSPRDKVQVCRHLMAIPGVRKVTLYLANEDVQGCSDLA